MFHQCCVVQTSSKLSHHEKKGLLGMDTVATFDVLMVFVSGVELQPLITILSILSVSPPSEIELPVDLAELIDVESCHNMSLRV